MISNQIRESIEAGSWVRKIFSGKAELIRRYGEENVFDFSLGNPIQDPPQRVIDAMKKRVGTKGLHRYMPNAGFETTRSHVANQLSKESDFQFQTRDITLCNGAGGGLNVVFRSLLNPGEEVMIFAPYFPEYVFYAKNCGAHCVVSRTDQGFDLDADDYAKRFTPKTKIVLINSPNNPSGKVYKQETINALGAVIGEMEKKFGHPIYLVSDEPYRELLFDGASKTSVFEAHSNALMVNSHSKDLGLAGERIGYIAAGPKCENGEELAEALVFCNRVLGFVNAPALMQAILPDLDGLKMDFGWLREIRDEFYGELIDMGFEMEKPEGAFYFFPKIPVEDDIRFAEEAFTENILLVPGFGFGRKGHVRISFSCDPGMMRKSIPAFRRLMEKTGAGAKN